MRIWVKRAVLLFLCLLMGLVLFSQTLAYLAAQPPSSIIFEKDLVYAKVGETELHLDLARPKQGKGPFPVVICVHGGGWKAGSKDQFLQAMYSLSQQGYVAASVQYRFAPKDRFPSQIDDVKTAVRYLRSRAKELNLNPDKIGAVGGSAGAHLSLLLGTTGPDDIKEVGDHPTLSSAVQAVVSIAGPTDLTPVFPDASEQMVRDLIGKSRKDDPDAYKKASPIHFLNRGDAPALLIHGTKDELVPYEQATSFIEAAKKAGVEAELFTIKDGGHGGGGKPQDWADGVTRMVRFLDNHLKK